MGDLNAFVSLIEALRAILFGSAGNRSSGWDLSRQRLL